MACFGRSDAIGGKSNRRTAPPTFDRIHMLKLGQVWEGACPRWQRLVFKPYLAPRSIANPAQVWLTGISSRRLMFTCAGVFITQKIVSAMSCGWIGSAPA